ncbi:30S ribosomal protein S15 (macronuclear) [Tetrahymena thermophila SB210]|uniref:30S ribosomal protein S15 n=1 Tax=Tetrahymena thermophila (strain SB210) TaxID=312017 RepID=Q22WF3_TETTS|nr:30S ribosomal protein S15 [Tetrahymena thermophila SB210]EAR89464.2 30S ribosomal protein S15 [Tetrahymena thermophila SB210]6Z1P_Bo Chain Bo, 30S ribosomal protein S15 [Tetrahymena thermophila SB210]|eukprot:XP_001009709.2 30S ribosomal protein S15 [Tetrahymena thermophila SB210]
MNFNLMQVSLVHVVKRGLMTMSKSGRQFARDKPLEEFIPKGLEKLKQKEQVTINTNYKAGFTSEELEPYNEMVKRALKLNNASPFEITQFKVQQAIQKFKVSPRDTGSAAIQVAVRTEKLIKMIKHCQENRQDKYAGRALVRLLEQRRKWLDYLRFTDYHRYKWICEEFCIPDQPPLNGHHKANFRGEPNRQVKTI